MVDYSCKERHTLSMILLIIIFILLGASVAFFISKEKRSPIEAPKELLEAEAKMEDDSEKALVISLNSLEGYRQGNLVEIVSYLSTNGVHAEYRSFTAALDGAGSTYSVYVDIEDKEKAQSLLAEYLN